MTRQSLEDLVGKEQVLLALSACVGGTLGLILAHWQWAVEIAQVQTGIVAYGKDSIPGIIQGALWSLTNQIAGLLLLVGMSERTASAVVSFALGALWFQSITMFVFALCRNAPLAFGAALVCFLSDAAVFGATYPALPFWTPHTHGVVGLMFPVLVVALLAGECKNSGALLLGLAPAFHLPNGMFVILCVGVAIIATRRITWPLYRSTVKYFVGGLGLMLVSLLAHLSISPRLPEIDSESAHRFFFAFSSFWDGHRQPVDWTTTAFSMALASLGVALAHLWSRSKEAPRTNRFLPLVVALCSGGGLILSLVSWLPASLMPMSVSAAMPGRLVNIGSVMFVPLLFGLFARADHGRFGRAMWVILSAGLLLSGGQSLAIIGQVLGAFGSGGINRIWILACAGIGAVVLGVRSSASGRRPDRRPPQIASITTAARMAGITGLALGTGIALGMAILLAAGPDSDALWNRSDEPALSATSSGQGLLLTGGDLWLVQLRTRRPVLLDGGTLDTLPYVIQTSFLTDRVLREVYGVDLVHPPPDAQNGGVVPNETNRKVWERYSRARWLEIRSAFGVTQVLTRSTWQLDLPLAASSPGLRLYSIPEPARPSSASRTSLSR